MLLCANAALEENKQKINELNVFPVPDGDTGTNMSLTMNSAAIELGRKQTDTVGAVADCAASALLRGARGNSGVILSLLFRGIAKSLKGRETVRSVVDALCAYRDEVEEAGPEKQEPRVIPLYRNPAAAGYASPVFGEDFDYIPVTEDVPQAAEFAVRISGDSMAPYIADGSVVYVNRDPLREGDVGIFCVDGDLFCKQYYKDPAGVVYLFSLNRKRADADVILPPSGSRGLVCFGRVILHPLPLPGRD